MSNVVEFDPGRVGVTDAARKLIEQLKQEHGPLHVSPVGGLLRWQRPDVFRRGRIQARRRR